VTKLNSSIALVRVQSANLARKSAEALAIRGLSDLQSRENAELWFQRALDLLLHPPEELELAEDPNEEWWQARRRCLLKVLEYDPCHAETLCMFGNRFEEEGDLSEAVAYYQRAAGQGDVYAKQHLAYLFMNGTGKPELPPQEVGENCLSYFRRYAEQGNACAQYMFGKCFHYGRESAPKNLTQAVYWYVKAADQGYAQAQFNLGVLYEDGRGVTKDYVEAAKLYLLAAQEGLDEAQFRLGRLFYNGRGVPEDIEKAGYWFNLASKRGLRDAKVMLEICKAGISHDVMEKIAKEDAEKRG
jgi:TPR repeat protein